MEPKKKRGRPRKPTKELRKPREDGQLPDVMTHKFPGERGGLLYLYECMNERCAMYGEKVRKAHTHQYWHNQGIKTD